MKSDRVIESAIRAAQNLLSQNLPSTHKLPDAAAVARLRDLVRSPAVKSALLHSNDTFLAFVLRAVEFVLADQFRADCEIIDHLWDVLDDPQLNKALGLPQNSLSFPKIRSGRIRAVRENQTIIQCDGCDHLSARNIYRRSAQVAAPVRLRGSDRALMV